MVKIPRDGPGHRPKVDTAGLLGNIEPTRRIAEPAVGRGDDRTVLLLATITDLLRIANNGEFTAGDPEGRVQQGPLLPLDEHVGDEKSKLETLLAVQAWIAGSLVAVAEVSLEDSPGTANTLGDIVARELNVDAAREGAEVAVHLEKSEHLVDDVVE